MATLTVTIPNGTDTRAVLDRLVKQMRDIAYSVPNGVTGGNTVITFNNAPATGLLSVQVTSGPSSASAKKGSC